jgi:hypothetical protein
MSLAAGRILRDFEDFLLGNAYTLWKYPDKLSFSLTSKAVYDYVSGSWGPEKLLDLVERFPRPGRSGFLRLSSRVPLPLSREAHQGSRLLSCDGFSNVLKEGGRRDDCVPTRTRGVGFRSHLSGPREIWMTKAI